MTPYLNKAALYPPQIIPAPQDTLGMVVVIPAYNETTLIECLESLYHCDLPPCSVEVIVVINNGTTAPESVKEQNHKTFLTAQKWAEQHNTHQLFFSILHHHDLPQKFAGVGLARKIGMDEAVYRLTKVSRPQGVIVCYDADSTCEKNYLQAIHQFFMTYPKIKAASIYFEHPIVGTKFSKATYEAIVDYELHLRYYIEAQRWAGCPFAFHTVGSSMAVRADAYQAQGGMNRRKAGEDFYFLHKFIPLGYFGEINSTKVIPSPRTSDRVPFGTGKSVQDILSDSLVYKTYAPQTFHDLKEFLKDVPGWYDEEKRAAKWKDLPTSIRDYLHTVDFENKVKEIKNNIGNPHQFEHRFYRWFNAFQLMKFVHFARDHYHPNEVVGEAVKKFLGENGTNAMLLAILRNKQRAANFNVKRL